MFEDKLIRKKIEEAIAKGASEFIIFPFGANGVSVRNCLNDCFDTKAEMLVDNKYSQYNKKIVDIQYLKKNYSENMYVLFTIEDRKLNKKLEEDLLEFIPKDKIINFLENLNERYEPKWDIGTRFAMDNILPLTREEKDVLTRKCKIENNKIKVRILHGSLVMWNAAKTICEAFENDTKFDVLVILGVSQSHEAEMQMEREKHQYINYYEYCGELDRPDILIISLACDTYPYDLGRHAKLVVAASMTLIQYAYTIDDFWKDKVELGFDIHSPDYYLFDSMLYWELVNGGYLSDQLLDMGNANYDGVYLA